MERGYRVLRFACGGCNAKLAAALDLVGRLTVTEDMSGVSGEFPVFMPCA